MKFVILSILVFVLTIDFVIPDTIDNELILYKGLPQIKTSLTEKEKNQIMNGVQGAIQFFKFLEEKNFFSTLTKISSVAGPIFSAISAILTVVFMFIEIESPEMALMKKEFAVLNNRMDKWSVEFKIIKRKIDWSAVQINFGEIENNIIGLHKLLSTLPDVPIQSRETQASMFLNSYEINYKAAGDIIYKSIINVEQIYSVNLLRAGQLYMEYDRNQVQEFMVGLLKLITESMQLEAAYVGLKYNNEEATQFTQSIWEKKLAVLKEKLEKIDLETKDRYHQQYQIDLDNLLATHHAQSNEKFSSIAYDFFTAKYNWREWFIVVYNPISGFKDHAVVTCQGTHRFRAHGRNIIVSSVEKVQGDNAMLHNERNRQIIGSYNSNWQGGDYSKTWVENMGTKLPYCSDADTRLSIAWGSNVWFINTRLVVYQKNCVRNNSPCYNTYLFA